MPGAVCLVRLVWWLLFSAAVLTAFASGHNR